jgi:hypothetical protein
MASGGKKTEKLLEEMIQAQRLRLFEIAARILPGATAEDLLQPHDHEALAAHPEFNFEDGILAGYLAVQTALRAEARNPKSEIRNKSQ